MCVDRVESNWGEIEFHRFTAPESDWGPAGYPAEIYYATPSSIPEGFKEYWGLDWYSSIPWRKDSILIRFPYWALALDVLVDQAEQPSQCSDRICPYGG